MDVCRHNTLRRKCETCEAWAEVAEVNTKLAKLRAEVAEFRAVNAEISTKLAETRAGYRRIEDRVDHLMELLSQEVVETPTKKLKSTRPIESTPESAMRASVGRSASVRNWKYSEWVERFGPRTFKMLNASEKVEADARRSAP